MNVINRNPAFTTEGASQAGNDRKVEVDQSLLELAGDETEIISSPEESIAEKDQESKQVESQSQTVEDHVTVETDNQPEAGVEAENNTDTGTIKIGEKTYTTSELAGIVERGTKVKQFEAQMPGFNIDTLYPEFTRRSQKLAQYEKQLATISKQQQPEELASLGIEPEQIQLFEKLAKGLGFVRQDDLVERSVEAQKESFLERHKEYLPSSTGGNELWQQLMDNFSLYNWQANPHLVEQLLEESHQKVSKPLLDVKRGQDLKKSIITNQKKTQLASTGGGASRSGQATVSPKLSQSMIDKYRAVGWSDKDINELLT